MRLAANIYQDIAKRTGGDIYVGVVGPVRTGKSTFIKRFMEKMVIPNIENDARRSRMFEEYAEIREALGGSGASAAVARSMINLL